MIVYGSLDRSPLDFMSRDLIRSGAILEGFWLARHMESLSLPSKLRLVSKLTGFIRSGILSTEVGKVFPLEEVVAAVIEAERTGKSGKVLIQLS